MNNGRQTTNRGAFPSARLHFQSGHWFHNFIVALDRLDRLPAPIALVSALTLPALAALAGPEPRTAALALPAAALLVEAGSLLTGRLPERSPGPFAGPLLLFALGHALGVLAMRWLPSGLTLPGLILTQGALLAAMLYGFWYEPYRVGLRREEVQLGENGHELTALVISDLHLDRRGPREQKVIGFARAVRPNLILIPGDLTNLSCVDDPGCAADTVAFLRELRALAPVFVSRGTLEVDDPDWVRELTNSAGVTLLDNAATDFPPDRPAITLLGVHSAGPLGPHRDQLRRLAARTTLPVVLLYHTPDIVETAAAAGVGLHLAGHTHGGQICLPLIGPLFTSSRYGRRFAAGRYLVGLTTMIVSRGVGLEGAGAPRLRFLCPPEVVEVRIKA